MEGQDPLTSTWRHEPPDQLADGRCTQSGSALAESSFPPPNPLVSYSAADHLTTTAPTTIVYPIFISCPSLHPPSFAGRIGPRPQTPSAPNQWSSPRHRCRPPEHPTPLRYVPSTSHSARAPLIIAWSHQSAFTITDSLKEKLIRGETRSAHPGHLPFAIPSDHDIAHPSPSPFPRPGQVISTQP